MKKIINTKKAPQAIGAYSQAVLVDKWLYISGQIPLTPAGEMLAYTHISDHIRQVFNNLKAVLNEAGGELHHIVKLNVYLVDLNDFGYVNDVMAEFFEAPFPARAAVQVAELPKQARVEIDGVAYLSGDE